MSQNGEFGIKSFKTKKWIWIILKRDTGSTYAVVTTVFTTAWLGREERQLWVVARVKSLTEPCYVPPVLEQENDEDGWNGDEWRCCATDSSFDSCLAIMTNASHASLVVPLLKYLHHSHNAAANNLVGPYLGSHAKQAAPALGSNTFCSFSILSSKVVWGCGSATGFRYHSRMFTWMSGHAVAFRTTWNVSGSTIFVRDDMLAVYNDMCMWASLKWSNAMVINSFTSVFLFFSSNSCQLSSNSSQELPCHWDLGLGSVTSTPSGVRCCHRNMQPRSCTAFIIALTSASAMAL